MNINRFSSSTDSLIVQLDKLLFCAGLIDGEDSIWQILAGEGEDLLVTLNNLKILQSYKLWNQKLDFIA